MKKILCSFMLLIMSIFMVTTHIYALSNDIEIIRIHYFRYDKKYDGFNIWLWESEPTSSGGIQFDFSNTNVDEYGAWIDIDFKTNYPSATKLGIIIKKGGWDGYREIGGDRFIDLSKMEIKNKKGNVYTVQDDIQIGLSDNDLANNIPDYSPKILSASFTNNKEIVIQTSNQINSYNFYKNNVILQSGTNQSINFKITLNEPIDLLSSYSIEVVFDDNTTSRRNISIQNLYDTKEFEDAFTYNDALGYIYSQNKTIFRLWAPLSEKVTLNLYNQGHPNYSNNGTKIDELIPYKSIDLKQINNGAWEVTVDGNLANKYYTYTVTNYGVSNEVTDPYSYSTGANGLRSMVVSFSETNPENWEYNKRPNTIKNLTDYIVYELHVRDLTTHSSWNGHEDYRGKFLGFTETGTTYTKNGTTVTTGIDHIAELGVNAVQLLPIFDFGYIDEVAIKNDPNYTDTFNWGYMPYHFNTLEGSYSTNPFDGANRINEFKQLVNSLHEKDIRVIMDVVYNHTGESENSNFNKILPGYFHRMKSDGSFSNGSGTGNETASERSMVRKFMVDSVKFLATEYNLSGFRFDLMALHDSETMQQIRDMLTEIDPTIAIYGEPWDAGGAAISEKDAAGKKNIKNMEGVGAFNDITRDAIKGSVFNESEGAWLQGTNTASFVEDIKYGIVGGVEHKEVNIQDKWHLSPEKTINYVSAHDNNTLYDKLKLTKVPNSRIKDLQIQANAIILTSQGIPFLHAGVEFMRSKPKESGGYDENSYESPDSVNQLRWDRKAEYVDVFEYYKTLIFIRKTYPQFRMLNKNDIASSIKFINTNSSNIIAFGINNPTMPKVVVIHSGQTKGNESVQLPNGIKYRQLTSHQSHSIFGLNEVSDIFYTLPNTTSILIENKSINDVSLKKDIVKIKKGKSFNPIDNLNYDKDKYNVFTSSFYNTNISGTYVISLTVVDKEGNFLPLEYILNIDSKIKVTLNGEINV
ncbi:type I pullulanase [Haploplasma axanthum]|nr:type I pullulanase [Haploplasma axanthum]